jgi:hypothetical protein
MCITGGGGGGRYMQFRSRLAENNLRRKKERHRAVESEGLAESRSSRVLAESKTSSKSKTLRAAPTVLSMWPSKIKLDEEKSKHCRSGSAKWPLAQNFPTNDDLS